MKNAFIFGNRVIKLDETPSTNTYLQELMLETACFEGLVVVAKNQTQGKGQRGNVWQTEADKNLTFSLLLKPNTKADEQFLLSQLVALGVVDFLMDVLKINLSNPLYQEGQGECNSKTLFLEQPLKTLASLSVQIKWPNDVFLNGKKIAGILIENTLKANRIGNCIVGIGLNVNQLQFSNTINATSLALQLNKNLELEQILVDLLKHLEYRYLQLKAGKTNLLKQDYLNQLLGYQKPLNYLVDNEKITGIIRGISPLGKLQLEINLQVKEFDLKELSWLGC